MQKSALPLRVVLAIYALALALWGGGLIVLGAVVAPIVFHTVPAPTSADAMTLVFRRFDAIAITCAVVALAAEATLSRIGERQRPTHGDLARAACGVLAAACAIAIGAWVSPRIADLHRGGALRGLGEAGLALERYHRLAESLAKAELVFIAATLIMVVVRASRASTTR